jgi:GNAT superfamily N-acetyltransferase
MIREVELSDAPALFKLGQDFVAEMGLPFPEPNAEAIYQKVKFFLAQPNTLWLVAEQEHLTGFATFIVGPLGYCFELCGSMDTFYVTPKKRGTKTAILLLDTGLEWCIDRGAKVLQASPVSGIRTKQMASLFKKRGFQTRGFSMVRFV